MSCLSWETVAEGEEAMVKAMGDTMPAPEGRGVGGRAGASEERMEEEAGAEPRGAGHGHSHGYGWGHDRGID